MTERPYTDEDLRTQAALCQSALSASPTVADILRWLPGAYVTGRSGDTWGDVLDNTDLAETARKIHGLIEQADNTIGALDATRWLINVGADGLEPTAHTVSLDSATLGGDFARLHLAFHPGVPETDRVRFTDGLRKAIDAHL